MLEGIKMSELTEEEKKKLKLPKDIPLIEVDGEMLIKLDEPVLTKKVQKFFPFTSLIGGKQKQYMAKVHEEIKKRKGIPFPFKPFNGVFPLDVFVIEFEPIKENDDDCESE